jgi:hypothetical protein
MALSYRTRRRLAALILVVGLPAYIVAAVMLTGWINDRYGRLPVLAELAVYVTLGFLWALPFRFVFRGIGKPDPETETERSGDRSA